MPVCIRLLFTLSVFLLIPVLSETTVDPHIQQGDQAFNQLHYRQAQTNYLALQAKWAKQPASSLAYAELLNNLAATQIMRKQYKQAKKTLRRVNQLKQKLVQTIKTTKQSDNLLQNGSFEEGLIFPWGTGHYERTDGKFHFGIWWNSNNAHAFMKIDTAIKYSGHQSLQVGNASPAAPHVFSTLSQRISGLQPNQVYHIEYYLKARDLKPGTVSFAIDPGWNKRLPSPPPGTYDWRHFEADINIGHNNFIDFRILSLNTGFFWLDEIRVTPHSESKNAYQQAEALYDAGKYKLALDRYIKLQKKASTPRQKAYAGWLAGKAQMALGAYPAALSGFEQALKQGYLHAHIDLGKWAMQMGDYTRAEDHFKQAAEIFKGDQNTFSLVLNLLSSCYLTQEKYELALANQKRAYRILVHIDNQHGQALALNQLGQIQLARRELVAAKKSLKDALEQAQRLDDPLLILDIKINFAWLEYFNANQSQAQIWLNQALPLAISLQAPIGQIRTLRLLSLVLRESYPDAAILFGKQAVNGLQNLRSGLSILNRKLQQQFVQNKAKTYEELADLLIQQGRLAEAQQVLTMLKEEEYFDFVRRDSNNSQDTQRLSYNPQEQIWNQQIENINKRLVTLGTTLQRLRKAARNQNLTQQQQQQQKQAHTEFKMILREYKQWLGTVRKTEVRPEKEAEIGVINQHLNDLKKDLQSLGDGVVLIHYLITESQLHIILTTQHWQRVHNIQITAKTLNKQISDFRASLRNPRNQKYLLYGKTLYQSLIKPLMNDLQESQAHTLMLSLDGVLRYIPLAALYDGRHFLLENYALANYTDAAKAHITTPPKTKWSIAGLGLTQKIDDFSALPAVADELEIIIRKSVHDENGIYNGVIYLDHDFNTKNLLQVLNSDYPVLHIASHFVFKPGTEKDSYLLLGNGKHLDLGRIRKDYRFPQVDMLTLSACQTAIGSSEKEGNGREIEGFGVLAQKNGAKSVIASLWSVDDRSTSLLMQQLYQHLQQGHNKAQALRLAQLSFISTTIKTSSNPKYFRHPYYWAAFILMGNWQ